MKTFVLVFLLLASLQVHSQPVTDVKLITDVVKVDRKEVVIKNEKGEFSVPRAAVKNKKVAPGKEVELYLDSKAYDHLRAQFILDQHKVKEVSR